MRNTVEIALSLMEKWASKWDDIIGTFFSMPFHFYLIVCPHAFGLQDGVDSTGHTFYKPKAHFFVNLVPLGLDTLPQLDHSIRWTLVLVEPSLQRRPEVLDRVEVWRLGWPLQNLEWLPIQPLLDTPRFVLRVIVLLENGSLGIHVVPFDRSEQVVPQDSLVHMLVHHTLDLAHESRAVGGHAAPDHDGSASMLDCLLDMAWLLALTVANPAPRTPIRAEAIDLRLIRPYHMLPVVDGPVPVAFSKLETGLDVFGRESRLRFLLHSL